MTSDFAPEVAKYPQNPQIAQNGDLNSVWAYCLALLSDAACFTIDATSFY